jgi:hypothetical protein
MPPSAVEGGHIGQVQGAVGRLLAEPISRVHSVRREPLEYDAFLAGRWVARITGIAVVDGTGAAWAFIEKVTEAPGVASAYLYDNGAREFAAYRSGLLEDLARGLVAPRLLRAQRSAEGRLTLWIEDVGDRSSQQLSHPQILMAAQHLGRMAARWRGRVPDHRWLFHGWLDRHSQPEAVADGLTLLDGLAARSEVEAKLGRSLEDGKRLVRDQHVFKAALASLPLTLCHHDAVAANVFPRAQSGVAETVLIDWESVGPGPAGADLASLLFSSARRGDLSARELPALLPLAFEAYSEGVAEEGAAIDEPELRLGLFGTIALRWTLVRDVVRALEGAGTVLRGSAPDEPPDEALEQLLALIAVLFEAEAAARRLLRA